MKDSLSKDENVYLRGFGSFIVKEVENGEIFQKYNNYYPAHTAFKTKVFAEQVKKSVAVK